MSSTRREAPKRRDSDDRTRRRSGGRAVATADPPSSRRTRTRGGRTTAPTREARVPSSGPQTSPITRPVDRPARAKNASQAKARAKARKAKAPRVVRPKLTERLAIRLASVDLRPSTLISKVPFVVLVIGSLGVGLGLTLWLSTDAAERSYELSHARERTRMLQQQKEALERDVREAASAPALAEAARRQGMIPTRDTAHLVQAPDGSWVVVGTPKPADGVQPPPLNAKLPEEAPPAPPSPAVTPAEVPVRVQPGPGDPAVPGRGGPQPLQRTPDGASTLNGIHQVGPVPVQVPGLPAPIPGVHDPQPAVPGQAAPPPATIPGLLPQFTIPGQLPLFTIPGQLPPAAGVPLPAPQVPQAPQAPTAPVPPAFPDVHGPAPAATSIPAIPGPGEQFGPVTPSAPSVPGAQR